MFVVTAPLARWTAVLLVWTAVLPVWMTVLPVDHSYAQEKQPAAAPKADVPEPSSLNRPLQVDGVEVSGNDRIDAAAVESLLKVKRGATSTDQVSRDVKTLYQTGFFDQVTASLVASSDGRNLVRYTVVEKPVVRKVFIKGNKEVSESELSEVLKFDARRFMDKAKVDSLVRNARSYYQAQGFYDAKLSYETAAAADNQVDVTFTVDEGDRYRIKLVSIRGLKELDEDDVLDVVQTKEYKWWSSWIFGTGRLNKEMLENDKTLIRQFLLDHGYVDGNVGEPSVDKGESGISVVFDVTEGPQYNVGRITASGDLVEGDVSKTLKGIKSESGEVFSAATIRADTFIVSEKFTDIGFAFANVVPNTNINRESKTVDLDFSVDKGKLVSVNRVKIQGNVKTYDNVIRREVRLNEQETYSGRKLRRSQERLQRLGYFEEVNVSTEPTPRDDEIDVNVNVREAATGTFTAGAGFSTADGVIFNTRVTENNVLGTGRSISFNADLGTQRTNLIASVDDRRFLDTYWSLGFDLLKTQRNLADFDRDLTGGSLSAGYPLEELLGESFQDVSFATKYELLDVEISDVDPDRAAPLVIASEGRTTSSSITPSLMRNTINNPLNPTKGSRQQLSFETAGLGGDQDFFLLEAANQWYVPLIETEYGDLVFSNRTRLGYGDSNTDDPFPLFKRYFPGGINSVRGFRNRSLGPKDADGNVFGGAKQVVNNAELIFPLINAAGLRGIIFYDIGNAFDDNQSITFGEMREAYGTGIRWSSPLGPIRLEFGFPIDREDGEDNMVTMFSFGAPL